MITDRIGFHSVLLRLLIATKSNNAIIANKDCRTVPWNSCKVIPLDNTFRRTHLAKQRPETQKKLFTITLFKKGREKLRQENVLNFKLT